MATSQDMLGENAMATLALENIDMTELLECDSRPTFILDLERTQDPHQQRIRAVFSNAPLQRLSHVLDPAQSKKYILADDHERGLYLKFKTWAMSSPISAQTADNYNTPFEYQGLLWIRTTLRKRWRIISGSAVTFSSRPAGLQEDCEGVEADFGDAHVQGERGQPQQGLRPIWVDELPASEHVQFFKDRDWSATALGPLETWSVCLRQMTRFLMSDSRAACIFWYNSNIELQDESC